MNNGTRLALIFIALIIQVSIPGFGQDTAWRNISISPDVSIYMPGPINTLDTVKIRITTSRFTDYMFQVKYLEPKYEVRNGDELVQAYDGFLKGYLNSTDIKLYTNAVSDTFFNGTTGKWIHSTYSKNNGFLDMFTYVVLVNSHFYMITFAAGRPIGPTTYPMFSRYCSSIHFPNQPIKEYSGDFPLRAASYHLGQKIGTLMPYFAIAAICILALILGYNKFIRKRKSI